MNVARPARLALPLALALALASGCVARVVVPPPPPGPPPAAGIELWSERHPAASRELGAWVNRFPAAAQKIFLWDSRHEGAAVAFVNWTVANPGAGVDAFAAVHPGWSEFDWLVEHHRPAGNAFMGWCRRHPRAAEALVRHPGGLAWAGTHLYQGAWDMRGAGF